MNINGYIIDGELNHENSGFSKWGFCTKNGKEYFIKEFLAPIYPLDTSKLSEKQIKKRLDECADFESKMFEIYKTINECSDGNIVRILEFFRYKSKYYIVTEKINAMGLSVEKISKLPIIIKRHICRLIAHSVTQLHENGFVHADIKPNNIIIIYDSVKNKCSAKIIDFDCGFFGDDAPEAGEELNGDPIYFAPEMILHMMEEDVALSCKIDVFALGILFHQYFCGKQPDFESDKYDYVAEAVLDGGKVTVDVSIPSDMASIIKKMLKKEPFERISMKEVYELLSGESSDSFSIKILRGNR